MKKFFLFLLSVIGIVLLGGIGSLFINAYTPRLASVPFLNTLSIFKKITDRVTVINKTEQIVVREDDSVEKIISQPSTAVVKVFIFSEDTKSEKNEISFNRTGVLLTNDGLIALYSEQPFSVTSRYRILFPDGTDRTADFFGYDTFTNIVFLRLSDMKNSSSIALANSDDVRVGKKVVVIGSAETEYQSRLAVGILGNINHTFNLSGKTVSSSEKLEGVFEMDVQNLGSFVGGPAVGFNGEMIGLVGSLTIDNTLHTFLIPANIVRDALNRAIAQTLTKRPVFGVYYLSITKTLALTMHLDRTEGALVYSPSGKTGLALLSNSSAMRAGLQFGDIILSIDGTNISPHNPLSVALSHYSIGDTILLRVLHNGEEKTISIQL
ncbi:MAG: S1C family serine protease [Candidatus Moranbacteria bacterium]|nr:S1C family serine protease [Candidatus Moranbacteria bacterium]MDD3965038.1 S1C family serine protease [Candidatus Moranbacteria bacterium]